MNRKDTWGKCDEGEVCAADINSGLFASFAECKDVMGVFVRSMTDNDFIGQEKAICLAYGRVTGTDAYGGLVRGGRVIERCTKVRNASIRGLPLPQVVSLPIIILPASRL